MTEIKSIRKLPDVAIAQVLSYLKATGMKRALLINFGEKRLDPSQGERDKYDRLLRYIFLEDGTNFNELMISEGYAFEYTYNVAYKYQQEFKEMDSCSEAYYYLNTCGVGSLDRDKDGVPCESICD